MENAAGKGIRFGLMADIHHDLIPDAQERLSVFIDRMNREQVDFIIQLGDFCFPLPENRPFLQTWEQFRGPRYHVLGNHDMDRSDKRTIMQYLRMSKHYYSFDSMDYHFVVLDTNYIYNDGTYFDYENSNYAKTPLENINHVSGEQLDWLRQDLKATDKTTVIFSHQSLENAHYGKTLGIHNSDELRAILRETNDSAGQRKVIACFNGHSHVDGVKVIDDIYFIDINSMSYYYMGPQYKVTRYSEEITDKYKILSQSAPYLDPLFAIVSISPGLMSIQGNETEYVGPTPMDCGYGNVYSGHLVVPKISNRKLLF